MEALVCMQWQARFHTYIVQPKLYRLQGNDDEIVGRLSSRHGEHLMEERWMADA